MEDLRDVGKKALDSINNLGASDIGDLVLGIGEIIEELRDTPEDKKQIKLDHLRGLFREFAHGEEYELRDEVLEPQVPLEDVSMSHGGALSGVYSGVLPPSAPATTLFPPQQLTPPSSQGSFDDDADYDDEEEEIEEEKEEEEIKPFVPAWWKVKPPSKIEPELDD